ncbi:MAG TPA: S4 domain-containing protein [Opitutaceae bacterium]|nr:S4 domain-containing protein [Opitutaceae bacterium]
MQDCRLDKWLWCVRVYKTRAEATAACRSNHVQVNGLDAKPGRDVHAGEIVKAKVGLVHRTVKILGMPKSRVGAKQLPEFLEDLTPPAEYEKARQASLEHFLARERGRGRPTKKDRRQMGRLFGFD